VSRVPALALDPALRAALGLALAGVLFAAALPKLRRPREFARAVAGYELLPERAAPAVAAGLVAAELGLAGALVAALFGHAAGALPALGSAGLFALYAAAMAANLARGRGLADCGCSLGAPRPLSGALVARSAALALAALALALPPGARAWHPLDFATAAAGGLALFLLYAAGDTALANAARRARAAGAA